MTRNALAAGNNEAYGQVTAAVLYSPFCIIKNTGHGNFVVGHFHTRARKWMSNFTKRHFRILYELIANEPSERRRSDGEAAAE